jgi:hypothetical protein
MRTALTTLAVALLVAGTFAPAARADGGPAPGVSFGQTGITSGRGVTYATIAAGNLSYLVVRHRGRTIERRVFDALYGIPYVTFAGTKAGLSRDGHLLVLARAPEGGHVLASSTRLLVLDTATLRTRRTIDLPGDFSFDALSPDARTMFLIQHTSALDYERYRVRAYDLVRGRLLPNAIVDRTEPNMRGFPMDRLVAPGGAWVYTFYLHQGGEPFVHALDTVHARARCLDIEWHGNPNVLWSTRLRLDGTKLHVVAKQGRTIATLQLRPASNRFAAGWAAAGFSGAALAATALALWYRWRRRLTGPHSAKTRGDGALPG